MARRHTDEEKAAALDLLGDPSLSFYEVKAQTGVPVGTLHRWASEAGLERSDATTHAAVERRRLRIAAKREALAEELLDRIAEINARMDQPHEDFRGKDNERVEFERATSADARNYAVTIGVLMDKFRLEMGEATGISETRTDASKARQTVEERLDELASKRQEREVS